MPVSRDASTKPDEPSLAGRYARFADQALSEGNPDLATRLVERAYACLDAEATSAAPIRWVHRALT